MRIKIVVEGEPIPAARLAMKGHSPFSGAMSAVGKLYRKYRPTARIFGDVDNHLKALFDGMNQIVFVENPRAEIFLSEA